MRAALLMTALAVALSAGAGSAEASTKLTRNFWVYTGTKYRRGGAEGAMLGSAGIVRKTFLKAYDYERKELFGRDLLGEGVTLKFRKPVRVRGTSVTRMAHQGMFRYLTLSVQDTIDQLRKGELDLIKVEISSEGDLIRAINASPRYLQRIKRISPDRNLRIVTAVWVVVRAREYSDFEGTVQGQGSYEGFTLKGNDRAGATSDFTIKPGTIFAYQFAKVNWSENGQRIVSLKVDRPNM
ncbi:MAG TPA: hypothetical protein VFU21_05840 [Kofleriaceae bacterium]|nr:hypothetical protein [Kofleriaceae bacterium]